MRLLNTTTLELHEFSGSQIPYYAILSHRWGDGEVTFQDMKTQGRVQMEGWSKITGCCAQARSDGWQYAWIDSCCIDKSSSSELSEAINSMYQWYKNSQVCYAYLSDVPPPPDAVAPQNMESPFRKSQWFTRGWTLQELLAPESLAFFDCTWQEIGTKSTMASLVSSITGIDRQYLRHPSLACIAQKMSWASRRKTLREEDMAYCLMGLFGVHMPLLYGEGTQAFLRLQIEIIEIYDDESIFAWADEYTASFERCGMLALHPAAFKKSGSFLSNSLSDPVNGAENLLHAREMPFLMTNKGLQISLSLLHEGSILSERNLAGPSTGSALTSERKRYIAPLNCVYDDGKGPCNVVLRLESTSNGFSRIECDKLLFAQYPLRPASQDNANYRYADEANTTFIEKGSLVPQTIFVRDNRDQDFTHLASVCETHLRIEQLLQGGFILTEKPFLTPEIMKDVSTHWNHGRTITVEGNLESIQRRGGLIAFKFTSQADSFVLLLCQWKAYHGIELLYTSEARMLDHRIRKRLRPGSISERKMKDRAMCLLSSGTYVLASLKKGIDNGRIVSVVEFNIEASSQRLYESYLGSLENAES